MKILLVSELINKKDQRYFEDLCLEFDKDSWEKLEYKAKFLNSLFSSKFDTRFSSMWITPNGVVYYIQEGCHEHTARNFISEEGYVFGEDSLSEYCIRISDWLGLRLPTKKKVTNAQIDAISSMTWHKKYKDFMSIVMNL